MYLDLSSETRTIRSGRFGEGGGGGYLRKEKQLAPFTPLFDTKLTKKSL